MMHGQKNIKSSVFVDPFFF